jgi:hypothetical protein
MTGCSLKSSIFCFKGIICLSLLMFLFIQTSDAQDIAPESIIPAYSASCILVDNVPKIAAAIKASPVWQEITVKIEQEIGKNSSNMPSPLKYMAANMWDILALAANRVVIVHIDPEKIDSPSVIVDLGSAKTVFEMAQKVIQLLGGDEKDNIVPNAGVYLDVPYGSVKPDARFAFINNLLVYAPDQNSFEDIINVYRDKEPSILEDPKFNTTINNVTSVGEILIYINSELANPLTQILTRNEPMKILGTGDVKASSFRINLLSPTRDLEFYMYSGNSDSVMANMLSQSGSLISPHIIPQSSADIFYAFNTGSLSLVYDRFMDSIKSTMTEDEYKAMQDGLSKFEQEKGLNIKNDILAALTGEMGVAFGLPGSASNQEGTGSLMQKGIMVFLGINDQAKAIMCLERLFAGQPMEQTQYKGIDIRYIPSMNSPDGPFGYMFADNLMVLSNIKSLMSVIDEDTPLVASESFAQIGSRLKQPSNALFYVDLQKIMALIPPTANQSEESLTRLMGIGAIGGSMNYDGKGFKTIITGDQSKNWLEIIGDIINTSIQARMKD